MRKLICSSLLIVSAIALSGCSGHHGTLDVFNRSSEAISLVTVKVCGQTLEMRDLMPAKGASSVFKVTGDCHFDVSVRFQSGKTAEKSLGYITDGYDFDDDIVITDSRIFLAAQDATR